MRQFMHSALRRDAPSAVMLANDNKSQSAAALSILRKCKLLCHLPEATLQLLVDSREEMSIEPHEVLFEASEPSEHFYILLSGALVSACPVREGQRECLDTMRGGALKSAREAAELIETGSHAPLGTSSSPSYANMHVRSSPNFLDEQITSSLRQSSKERSRLCLHDLGDGDLCSFRASSFRSSGRDSPEVDSPCTDIEAKRSSPPDGRPSPLLPRQDSARDVTAPECTRPRGASGAPSASSERGAKREAAICTNAAPSPHPKKAAEAVFTRLLTGITFGDEMRLRPLSGHFRETTAIATEPSIVWRFSLKAYLDILIHTASDGAETIGFLQSLPIFKESPLIDLRHRLFRISCALQPVQVAAKALFLDLGSAADGRAADTFCIVREGALALWEASDNPGKSQLKRMGAGTIIICGSPLNCCLFEVAAQSVAQPYIRVRGLADLVEAPKLSGDEDTGASLLCCPLQEFISLVHPIISLERFLDVPQRRRLPGGQPLDESSGVLEVPAEASSELSMRFRQMLPQTLRAVPQLHMVDDETLVEFARDAVPCLFLPGDKLIDEGDSVSKDVFFMVEGEVHVMKGPAGLSMQMLGLKRLSSGALLGERSVLRGCPRTATVVATEPSFCLRLSGKRFLEVCPGSVSAPLLVRRMVEEDPQGTLGQSLTEPVQVIGKGAFGPVQLNRNPSDDKIYVCKLICRDRVRGLRQQASIFAELRLLRELSHPLICNIEGTLKSHRYLCLILEPLLGGDMFKYLTEKPEGTIKEDEACFHIACTLAAIAHVHSCHVVYRDLKPENVVLGLDGYVRLIDFGYAKKISGRTYSVVGTVEYLASEVILQEGHMFGADWWALGVLLYEMVCGVTPYTDVGRVTEEMQICRNISAPDYAFPFPPNSSVEFRHLVLMLLMRDPIVRLGCGSGGARDVMAHPFFALINWDLLLLKRLTPPFIPELKEARKTSNFDQVSEPGYELVDFASDAMYDWPDTSWDYFF